MPISGAPEQDPDLTKLRARIPDEEFRRILELVPTPTTDAVFVRVRDGVEQFMLGLRTEEPFKGTWFVVGGRQRAFESRWDALRRNMFRETGVEINTLGVHVALVGVFDVYNPPSIGDTQRPAWHSVWMFHKIMIPESLEPKALAENKEIRWFIYIEPDFPDCVKNALRAAGFHEKTGI